MESTKLIAKNNHIEFFKLGNNRYRMNYYGSARAEINNASHETVVLNKDDVTNSYGELHTDLQYIASANRNKFKCVNK